MPRKKKGPTDVEAETVAKLNEATDGVLGREAVESVPVADPADVVIGHMLAVESIRLADEREGDAPSDEDAADPDPRLIARIRTGRPCPREVSGALCVLPDCADECVIVRGEQAKAELDAEHADDSDPFGFRALARHEGEAHLHMHAIRAYLDAANALPPGEDDAMPEWDLLAQEDRDRLLKLYRRQAVAFDGFDLDPDGDADMPDAATALAIYQSIAAGKVKIAQWKGRALVSATGETVGSVLLTPNGYGARYGRCEREDDAPEDVCCAWVEAAAVADGWAVLP